MSSLLPDGFEVRPSSEADAADVAELARRSEHEVLGTSVLTESDIRDWWRVTDVAQNVWLVHDVEDGLPQRPRSGRTGRFRTSGETSGPTCSDAGSAVRCSSSPSRARGRSAPARFGTTSSLETSLPMRS
jgi:hypothetical protein